VKLWPGKGTTKVFNLPHPSSHDAAILAKQWHDAIVQLRGMSRDMDGITIFRITALRGRSRLRSDSKRDLRLASIVMGDDAWFARPRRRPRQRRFRPSPDDRHTLIWKAPKTI